VDEVAITSLPPDKFDPILGTERAREFAETLAHSRRVLEGRTVWHINSTSAGGGVAEMLQSILCYLVGAGITTRWLVIDGNDDFFEVTKRLHHLLHGEPGDGGPLGPAEHEIYETALAADAERMAELIQPGDAVVLHDPQTLGLAEALNGRGANLIWTCHIGADAADKHTRAAWDFLLPYVRHTRAQVFSRRQYAWKCLPPAGVSVIPPCLDAFSPKNQHLDKAVVDAIIDAAGIIADTPRAQPEFLRQDGASAKVSNPAEVIEDERIPPGARLVTQISRWDPLKDHIGVMTGFVEHVTADLDAHLVLAGPAPESITDDPEGQQSLDELRAAWQALPASQRRRVHLACLPMDDLEENGAIVNALQRRSNVVVQKSLAEGFGLTVAEAMWKSRPTIGSRVGGIQDQIEEGVSGRLIDDPEDLPALGRAISELLTHPEVGERLGSSGHDRVLDEYLAPRHLTRYLRLIDTVLT